MVGEEEEEEVEGDLQAEHEGEEGVDIKEAVVREAKDTHHHNINPSIHMPLDQETTSIDIAQEGIIINISTIHKIKMAIIVLIEEVVEVVEVVEVSEILEEKEEETWEDS